MVQEDLGWAETDEAHMIIAERAGGALQIVRHCCHSLSAVHGMGAAFAEVDSPC